MNSQRKLNKYPLATEKVLMKTKERPNGNKKRGVFQIPIRKTPQVKEGGYLLSRIALQYHRR